MSDPIEAGQPIRVTRGMPDVTVVVNKDVTIVHEGVEYKDGDELVLSGPLAESFAFDGGVTII
jgi:hypothetical protein